MAKRRFHKNQEAFGEREKVLEMKKENEGERNRTKEPRAEVFFHSRCSQRKVWRARRQQQKCEAEKKFKAAKYIAEKMKV